MPENKKSKGDSLPKRTIKTVKVVGAEKRYKPTKHYVFIIQVTYTDDTEYVVYRRYSDFFDFHTTLLDQFPIEAGEFKEPRIIPYLPGRKIFARDKKKLADKRQGNLDDYCRELINLKDAVSKCKLVREFFDAKHTDLNPEDAREKPKKSLKGLFGKSGSMEKKEDGNLDDITGPIDLEPYKAIADYKAGDKTEISFVRNQIVDVLEKNDNGWWLVQVENKQGWAPATYLESIDQEEEIDDPEPIYGGEPFLTLEAYVAEADDELSFDRNVILDVLHKHLDGWWVASYNGNVGYLPASYVQPYNDRHLKPTESVIVRRKKNAKAKTTRKSVLDPLTPRKDLSIYKTVRDAVRKAKVAVPDLIYENPETPEFYDDVAEPVDDSALYENGPQTNHQMGILPNRSDDYDEEMHYSDVDFDDEDQEYENVPTGIDGIAPIPPPKDYKPELPPKAISGPPSVPPKLENGRKQKVDVMSSSSRSPEKPGRRKYNNANSSPKVSHTANTSNRMPAEPSITGSAHRTPNGNCERNNTGNNFQSELARKLEQQMIKNGLQRNSPSPKPSLPAKTVAASTPPLPKRAGHPTRIK